MSNGLDIVYLQCVKVKNKLRVRITTPGYKNDANCQFPRAIRVEGRKFSVKPCDVTLVKRGASYFYHIKKTNIVTLDSNFNISSQDIKNMIKKVYNTDDIETECIICLDAEKNSVFNPCGHFVSCDECASELSTCPLCRASISSIIDYEKLK